jgi:hypothetical protein
MVRQRYFKVVKGVPAALVRSYKEPQYDSVLVLAATPAAERVFYARPIGQTLEDNTTVKTRLHTNQSVSGQFGVPISFDVYGFNLRYPKDIVVADFQALTGAGVIRFLTGEDTLFLGVPAEDIPSGVDTQGQAVTDFPHIGWGATDNYYRFDIGGQGLHINSTENFKVTYSFPSNIGTVTQDTLVRFYMRGIKYRGV